MDSDRSFIIASPGSSQGKTGLVDLLRRPSEDDDELESYETPSKWQKRFHQYVVPAAARNSDFMMCISSPTDNLFSKQSEPVVVG